MTLTARATALLLGGATLAGCAQPGQLGHPLPVAPPAPPVAAAAAPVVQAAPATVEPVSGTVDSRVTIRTPGPAVYSVRTVVLEPGDSLGWHRHPGTEMAVVRSGDVTLVREDACDPVVYGAGEGLFVGDAVPHRLTNDGTAAAELLVTTLLAPGAEENVETEPACPDA